MTTPKFIFTYDPNGGAALTDGQVKGYADMLVASAIATGSIDVVVGNEAVMDCIRLAVIRGKLPYEDTVYKFKDELLEISSNGAAINWPKGFCDLNLDIVTELLTEQGKLGKVKKEEKSPGQIKEEFNKIINTPYGL